MTIKGIRVSFHNIVRRSKSNALCYYGIITEETVLEFRSQNAYKSIMLEISKQTFEIDSYGEYGFEKMMRILSFYFLKSQRFRTQHNIKLFFFSRIFYPQFSSIKEALLAIDQAHKEDKDEEVKLASLNQEEIPKEKSGKSIFRHAFQNDQQGNVFQDIYKCILIRNPKRSWEKNIKSIWKSFFYYSKALNFKEIPEIIKSPSNYFFIDKEKDFVESHPQL